MTIEILEKLSDKLATFIDSVADINSKIEVTTQSNKFINCEAIGYLIGNAKMDRIDRTPDFETVMKQLNIEKKTYENAVWELTNLGDKKLANKVSDMGEHFTQVIIPTVEKYLKGSLVYKCALLNYDITVK